MFSAVGQAGRRPHTAASGQLLPGLGSYGKVIAVACGESPMGLYGLLWDLYGSLAEQSLETKPTPKCKTKGRAFDFWISSPWSSISPCTPGLRGGHLFGGGHLFDLVICLGEGFNSFGNWDFLKE